MIAELDQGKLPDQQKFFEGEGSEKDLLLQKMQKNIGKSINLALSFQITCLATMVKSFFTKMN